MGFDDNGLKSHADERKGRRVRGTSVFAVRLGAKSYEGRAGLERGEHTVCDLWVESRGE